MHLSDHARQVVTVHHLQGDHIDGAVAAGLTTDPHRLQLRFVDGGILEPGEPVVGLGEGPMDLLDAALVVGGHVE